PLLRVLAVAAPPEQGSTRGPVGRALGHPAVAARRPHQGGSRLRPERRDPASRPVTARSVAGLVALDALLLLAGLGVLVGLGFVRSGRDALRHAGLGLVGGWALVGVLESWLLVAG